MSDVIKSAREIALEKLAQIEEATDDERRSWKYIPEGEKLAAVYLKQDIELGVELRKYSDEVAQYINKGAVDILVRNINLPKNDIIRKTNKRAMEGIKQLKQNKLDIENVYSKIRQIFKHYVEQGDQQRKQAYERLKVEFEAKMQQALQQQLGAMVRARIDVERQPQFQAEWQKVKGQLDMQYIKVLDEYKQEILAIN